MAKRTVRSDEQLREAAKHVFYELSVLIYAAEHLGGSHSSPMSTPSDNDLNVALDSFLLHFRNLRAFLCPSIGPFRDDDILASDFLKEPRERDFGDPNALTVDKDRIDKMLAHISYDRDDYIAKGNGAWAVARIAATVLRQFDLFLASLPHRIARHFPARALLEDHRTAFEWIALNTP